ncbi:hypothetical protein FRACA_900004 [Frankia canadensis]|uniref:Uncharacterized protein n=1 Tax=Frankia canadensis TaxID=1836972 RepID=A0A2I2L2C0_9ACTN|nr:hypothetical protein FRACA_900004 [Frankia canadensis]SOU59366.1 hypothetical protein FRACA_900004 [Frankia canadensis]
MPRPVWFAAHYFILWVRHPRSSPSAHVPDRLDHAAGDRARHARRRRTRCAGASGSGRRARASVVDSVPGRVSR